MPELPKSMRVTVWGILTYANHIEEEPETTWKIEYPVILRDSFYRPFDGDRAIFMLLDGPTGYESFNLSDNSGPIKTMAQRGWSACAGTPGAWDKLFIPAEEMRKAFEALGICYV